jgi:hypothetical protein
VTVAAVRCSGPTWAALAHLRNGDTPVRLAVGFGIGTATAWRYIREAVDLLAATAPTLAQAMAGIAKLAYAILDGPLIRTDRLTGPKTGATTPADTTATASTLGSSPTRPAGRSGSHRPCPAPPTT